MSDSEPLPVETGEMLRMLVRGAFWRCPRCGEGLLYEWFYKLRDRCTHCDLDFGRRAEDTWALIYLTTAGMTGAVIGGMLIFRPLNMVIGRTVLAFVALALIVFTLPSRKGFAIAFNYYIDLNSHHVDIED
jgi:uncharacterized protein (DUF983 family)